MNKTKKYSSNQRERQNQQSSINKIIEFHYATPKRINKVLASRIKASSAIAVMQITLTRYSILSPNTWLECKRRGTISNSQSFKLYAFTSSGSKARRLSNNSVCLSSHPLVFPVSTRFRMFAMPFATS